MLTFISCTQSIWRVWRLVWQLITLASFLLQSLFGEVWILEIGRQLWYLFSHFHKGWIFLNVHCLVLKVLVFEKTSAWYYRASERRSFFATRHLITGLALTSSRLSHIAPAIAVVVRLYRLTMSYVLRKCEEAFCTCSVSFFFKKKNKGEVVTVANYVSLLCRHIIPHHR